MAGWRLAIDFGTSFTTAAIWRDGRLTLVDVGGSQSSQFRMPSAVWIDDAGEIVVGWRAEGQAALAPERLERAPKQLLGDSEPMHLGRPVEVEEAVAAVLAAMLAEAMRHEGGSHPERITLTHPASWSNRRKDALLRAGARAGIEDPRLLEEPVGAAVYFTGPGARAGTDVREGGSVAVYDLGGGTFDTAVLRRRGDGSFETIGVGGRDGLGGEAFDTRLFRHLRSHLVDTAPKDWHAIERSPRALQAFRREVRVAKETLSVEGACDVVLPEVTERASVRVTRTELQALLADDVRDSVQILLQTCHEAGVDSTTLEGVFLVGGSSRIPLVSDTIAQELQRIPSTRDNPKAVVALGAAAATGDHDTGATVLGTAALRPEEGSPAPPPTQPSTPPDPPATRPSPEPAPVTVAAVPEVPTQPAPPVSEPPAGRRVRRPPAERPPVPRERRRRFPVALVVGAVALAVLAAAAAVLLGGSGDSDSGATEIPVGRVPRDVALGFGSAWVVNSGSGTLSRVPLDGASADSIQIGREPFGVAVGAGAVWTISPKSRRLVGVAADGTRLRPIELGALPYGIAAGFGSVWTATGSDVVIQVDPDRGRAVERIDVGISATEIAAGLGGVWAVSPDDDSVQRIDPRRGARAGRPIDVATGSQPQIAVGEGAVWVVSEEGALTRIAPSTGAKSSGRVPGEPVDVAAASGAVWVLDASGLVRQIDPEGLKQVGEGTRSVSGAEAIAAGEGAVWVTDTAGRSVLRLEP